MSTPVDVQGILERAGADADAAEGLQAWALAQVGAAVAELIEATIEFRAGIAALVICQEQDAPQDIYDAVAEKFKAASDRQDKALANVGSAS